LIVVTVVTTVTTINLLDKWTIISCIRASVDNTVVNAGPNATSCTSVPVIEITRVLVSAFACNYFLLTKRIEIYSSDISVSKINLVSITVLCVTGFLTFLLYCSFEILFRFSFSCQFSNHCYFSFNFSFYFRFRVYYIDQ